VELPYGCWAGDTPASADTSPREEQAAERCASACCPPLLRYHSAELNSPCLPLPKPGRELVPKLTRWRRAVAPMRRATFSTCSAAPHSTPRPVPVPRPSPSKVAEAAHRLQQPRGWSGAYLLRAAAAFPEHEARVQLGFPAAPPTFQLSTAVPPETLPARPRPALCMRHPLPRCGCGYPTEVVGNDPPSPSAPPDACRVRRLERGETCRANAAAPYTVRAVSVRGCT
jgi:hypothetical protein